MVAVVAVVAEEEARRGSCVYSAVNPGDSSMYSRAGSAAFLCHYVLHEVACIHHFTLAYLGVTREQNWGFQMSDVETSIVA